MHGTLRKVAKLIILTSRVKVSRFSDNELAVLIYKETLATLQQRQEACNEYSLPVQELLQVHFFRYTRIHHFQEAFILF